jgi:hemoglobin/transferrin/lactoferrin receptor protein
MTDLGTLGLSGSGYEVAAPDVAGMGASVGTTADANAVSSGAAVRQLEPENSFTYEVGVHYRNPRFDTDFAFFWNDVNDLIVKQSLILPPGAVGLTLGSEVITAQNGNGVVFVAASPNPVLVRANFDEARIYGFEHRLNWTIGRGLSMATTWTYIYAEDPRTGLPPNIEGGTPPADGYLILRYAPPKRRFWVEPYLHAAGRQERLSSLDLVDRRTGAGRTRSSISNFFFHGATVRGLVGRGADSVPGTADDTLLLTGETLSQVQDRVLGVGVQSGSLFDAVPGYFAVGLRGGFRVGESHSVLVDAENLGDRNYRGISWGLDAPGRNVSFRYTYKF